MNKSERKELYSRYQPWLDPGNHMQPTAGQRFENHGENMKVLHLSINGWWKPVVMFDCVNKTAVRFLDPETLRLLTVGNDDIDWESLQGLDDRCMERVKARNAHFPTNIRGFQNGMAEVEWQVAPDGRYYSDDDGYGMTDDEEVALLGTIDRNGNVVKRFRLKQNYL